MKASATYPIPVERIVEVQNDAGDTLCLNPSGQKGWHVQVIRGGQRHRRGGMQILGCDVDDETGLIPVIESFYRGEYERFGEVDSRKYNRMRPIFSVIFMMLTTGIALTFLAFMISFFMKKF